MAVTIKLALYFYAMTRLLGGEARQENAAANLGPFYVYLLLLPTVCLSRCAGWMWTPPCAGAVRSPGALYFLPGSGVLRHGYAENSGAAPEGAALRPAALRLWRSAAFQAGNRPRRLFFAQQGEHYSVCLLLADQNAPEGESAFKTASAAAPTPAQALENAAATLPGTVYYGLLDAAAPTCRG